MINTTLPGIEDKLRMLWLDTMVTKEQSAVIPRFQRLLSAVISLRWQTSKIHNIRLPSSKNAVHFSLRLFRCLIRCSPSLFSFTVLLSKLLRGLTQNLARATALGFMIQAWLNAPQTALGFDYRLTAISPLLLRQLWQGHGLTKEPCYLVEPQYRWLMGRKFGFVLQPEYLLYPFLICSRLLTSAL